MVEDITNEGIIAYRLGEVERIVKENAASALERDNKIQEKLDKHLEFQKDFAVLTVKVDSLMSFKNLIVGSMLTMATGLTVLFVDEFLNVVG